MIYSLFRIIIILILLLIYIGICKNRFKKKVKIIIVSIIIIISLAIYILPIENLFYSFNSPEDAFKYQINGDMFGIIKGENSAMILYNIDNTRYSYTIIPKHKEKWKIGNFTSSETVLYKHYDTKTITLYKYNKKNDYYLIITDLFVCKSDNVLNISDSRNSEFQYYSKDLNQNNMINNIYCTHIENFDDNYILNINNKPLKLK